MPWGLSGYGSNGSGYSRPPAPRRLTLEELLGQQFTAPPRPERIGSVADLQGQDRRDLQRQSLWSGLGALGASLSTGDWRHASAGAGQVADLQAQALEQVNARQEQEYEESARRAAAAIEEQKKRQEAAALLGVYEEIAATEPQGSPFVDRAERAARAGSMSELQQLMGEVPKRSAARRKGYDPDAWETNTRLQEELEAELKRQAEAASWEEERERLAEKERIEAEGELQNRVAQRDAGVLWEPPVPLSRIEAEERIRAKYRDGGAAGRPGRLGEAGGRWYWITPPDEGNPAGRMEPVAGQPKNVGNLTYFDTSNRRFVLDKERPELGAVEVPKHAQGDEGYEGAYREIIGSAPPPDPFAPKPDPRALGPTAAPAPHQEAVPQANLFLRESIKSLGAGAGEADVLGLLQAQAAKTGGRIDGFTPEEILAKARAYQARGRQGRR